MSPKDLSLKMIEDLASEYIHKTGKQSTIERKKLINDHIDIRLFGILFTVEDVHFKQVGPVQFAIGQSLNPVKEMPIRMTRIVPTKKGAEAGTFGEKFVVRYSFIEFHGFVNNNVAKEVDLTEEDVTNMLTAMWRGTTSLSTSSKYGQQSRLLIKINYKNEGYIGDLDLKSTLESSVEPLENLENILQMNLDVTSLLSTIKYNKDLVESIEYEYNPDLSCSIDTKKGNFEEIIKSWAQESRIKISKLNL